MRACREGNLATVQLLLAAGVDVKARNAAGQTALHHAARRRRVEALRELILQHNANMFVVDQDGKTPFDWACRMYWPSDFLMERYADKFTQDHGRLALHAVLGATEYLYSFPRGWHPPLKSLPGIRLPLGKLTLKHFRTMLSFLDYEMIRNRGESGELPVHVAIRNNAPVDVLSMLVQIDPATLHIADHAGLLPLHECCTDMVDDSTVRFLIEQDGVGVATLAAHTREGALPLHLLCGSTNPSWRTVQCMVQSFPGAVTARTNVGRYPFMIAACESSAASLSVVYKLVRTSPDLIN